MICGDDFLRLQKASPFLARRLYQFNYCPADYIHPSRRIAFDGGKLHDRVWETPRARASLSLHILKCLELENQSCFDARCPEWPLLLLDLAQLERLRRHLAAVIFNGLIRHSVLHDEVVTWRRRLGTEAYKFALYGFGLLPRAVCAPIDCDASQIDATSYGVIEAAMRSADGPIRLRAILKLPDILVPPKIEAVHARKLVNALMSILEPEWRSYFLAIQH